MLNLLKFTKQVPVGTTMRPPACFTIFPHPAVDLTDEQIFWAGLKHFVTFEVVLL